MKLKPCHDMVMCRSIWLCVGRYGYVYVGNNNAYHREHSFLGQMTHFRSVESAVEDPVVLALVSPLTIGSRSGNDTCTVYAHCHHTAKLMT